MYDLIEDVEVLSNVKRYNIDKLIDLAIYSISHDIIESIKKKEISNIIDIGIGYLYFEAKNDHYQRPYQYRDFQQFFDLRLI